MPHSDDSSSDFDCDVSVSSGSLSRASSSDSLTSSLRSRERQACDGHAAASAVDGGCSASCPACSRRCLKFVCAVACFSCHLLLSLQAQWICLCHHFLLLPAPRSPPWRRLSNICCARRHRPCSILHRFYGCVARLHSTCCTLHTHKPLVHSMTPHFCCWRLPAVPFLSFL